MSYDDSKKTPGDDDLPEPEEGQFFDQDEVDELEACEEAINELSLWLLTHDDSYTGSMTPLETVQAAIRVMKTKM